METSLGICYKVSMTSSSGTILSKNTINKVGKILAKKNPGKIEIAYAIDMLNRWRLCHAYPINTLKVTLRRKLQGFPEGYIVAQRLKRAPTIINKLQRYPDMQLFRMQDIGGLRAILDSVGNARKLERIFKKSKFNHELASSKDYIKEPKSSGYRGIHLVYKYKNNKVPQYNGLLIELQIRTKLQHVWATTVETMGTFLGEALKSSQGDKKWLSFFSLCSAAFAHIEKTAPVPGFENKTKSEIFKLVKEAEKDLNVLTKMDGFAAAANLIHNKKGSKGSYYHLIILNSLARTVRIASFAKDKLKLATQEYAQAEKRIQKGERLEAVLVSAGPLNSLRRAYPNYFLDTKDFALLVKDKIISKTK